MKKSFYRNSEALLAFVILAGMITLVALGAIVSSFFSGNDENRIIAGILCVGFDFLIVGICFLFHRSLLAKVIVSIDGVDVKVFKKRIKHFPWSDIKAVTLRTGRIRYLVLHSFENDEISFNVSKARMEALRYYCTNNYIKRILMEFNYR